MSVDRIVAAGMAVFAEVGFERLSMRLVAGQLGVQPSSLYHHVRNKAVLLGLMADRAAQEGLDAGTAALAALPPGAGHTDRVRAQLAALRVALLRHPGGVLLFTSSPHGLGPGALGLMERLLGTLRRAGLTADDSVVAADTLLSYVTGFVLQEQVAAPPQPAVAAVPADEFPLTASLAGRFDDDQMFTRSTDRLVRLLVGATPRVGADPTG